MRATTDDATLDRLINMIYRIPSGNGSWSETLERICAMFDASGSLLVEHNFGNRRGRIRFRCRHHSPEFDETYRTKMCGRNPWLHSDLPYQNGSVFIGTEILSESELKQSEFYRECLSENGHVHRLCGVICREGLDVQFLSIENSLDRPAFDEGDKAQLRRILPHLSQCLELCKQLRIERSEREALHELLDHVSIACLLVNQASKVCFVNSAAARLLEKGDGLATTAGCLTTSKVRQTSHLRSTIAKLASLGTTLRETGDEHLVIMQPSNGMPLLLTLFAVHQIGLEPTEAGDNLVAVLTKDPNGNQLESLTGFAGAYRLTNAETRLVELLAAGQGLFQAAKTLGVTKNTARTHMRHIYSKVGIHSQADLVRLLSKHGTA